jgi:uncharacterized membrane protein YccC
MRGVRIAARLSLFPEAVTEQVTHMDYVTELKKYITSHQTSLAIRVTFSVVIPPVVFYNLHEMPIGAALSIGALCTSLTDTPGPPHHRRNGFYASIILNCITAILVGFTNTWHYLLGMEIFAFSFLFSFISIFGNRASSVGVMALLVLILTIDARGPKTQVVENGLYIALGGVWYAFLSLVLYRLFPYRLAQQAVGESIISTARYLRIKGQFYETDVSIEDAYTNLMKEQVVLQDKQEQVRELLFKTRRMVNDSTPKSRVLLMMFVDSVDLFEIIMSTQRDYGFLRGQFDGAGILGDISDLIVVMAKELEDIGVAVQASTAYREESRIPELIRTIQEKLDRLSAIDPGRSHLEGYISLNHVVGNIKDIRDRIHRLSLYSHYDEQTTAGAKGEIDYTRFITHQPIDAQVFMDNLTLRSQAFRHALRLSLAMLAGYIISRFLPFGHGYWILLSISVILKPMFGSTKKLYFQRLGGTLLGAALGGVLLFFLTNGLVLMSIMVFTMILGYSMQRRNYFVYTVFLTIFVLIAFHFLYNHDFREIVKDRVVETAIGSLIALLAGFILIPSWSQETMLENMRKMILANQRYFSIVARAYGGLVTSLTDFKVARKEAFVALANLSDNFQRILSEPRSKQKNVPFMHQFVVSNQMYSAHTASLAYYKENLPASYISGDFATFIRDVNFHLDNALLILGEAPEHPSDHTDGASDNAPNVNAPNLTAPAGQPGDPLTASALKPIADQFIIIHTLSRDIEHAVRKYEGKAAGR